MDNELKSHELILISTLPTQAFLFIHTHSFLTLASHSISSCFLVFFFIISSLALISIITVGTVGWIVSKCFLGIGNWLEEPSAVRSLFPNPVSLAQSLVPLHTSSAHGWVELCHTYTARNGALVSKKCIYDHTKEKRIWMCGLQRWERLNLPCHPTWAFCFFFLFLSFLVVRGEGEIEKEKNNNGIFDMVLACLNPLPILPVR